VLDQSGRLVGLALADAGRDRLLPVSLLRKELGTRSARRRSRRRSLSRRSTSARSR
jgi:hypothetical protein